MLDRQFWAQVRGLEPASWRLFLKASAISPTPWGFSFLPLFYPVYLVIARSCIISFKIFCVFVGHCQYGADLAKQLTTSLRNVLPSCGSVRISFSRRTPQKVHMFKAISKYHLEWQLLMKVVFNRYLRFYWERSVIILRFKFGMVKVITHSNII